jgi:hypothetical protein
MVGKEIDPAILNNEVATWCDHRTVRQEVSQHGGAAMVGIMDDESAAPSYEGAHPFDDVEILAIPIDGDDSRMAGLES